MTIEAYGIEARGVLSGVDELSNLETSEGTNVGDGDLESAKRAQGRGVTNF